LRRNATRPTNSVNAKASKNGRLPFDEGLIVQQQGRTPEPAMIAKLIQWTAATFPRRHRKYGCLRDRGGDRHRVAVKIPTA
jgi:hypothetical protein